MNTIKTKLGLLIPLLITANAYAIDIYDNGSTSASVGGYLDVRYVKGDTKDEITDGISRINFGFNQKLTNDWEAFAKVEWGITLTSDPASSLIISGDQLRSQGDQGDSIWLRQGYVGFKHDNYGSISMGKQWGSIYHIASVTDVLPMYGGNASGTYNFGTDGSLSGTGRAERALQYNNQIGNFFVSAQVQSTEESINLGQNETFNEGGNLAFDTNYGLALTYLFPYKIGIGAGFNTGEVSLEDSSQQFTADDQIATYHITYGQFNKLGLYMAALYSDMENHEINNQKAIMTKSTGIEAVVAYKFDNRITAIAGYNDLTDDSGNSQYNMSFYTVGVTYEWTDNFVVFADAKFDDTTYVDGSKPDLDIVGFGFRFYL